MGSDAEEALRVVVARASGSRMCVMYALVRLVVVAATGVLPLGAVSSSSDGARHARV